MKGWLRNTLLNIDCRKQRTVFKAVDCAVESVCGLEGGVWAFVRVVQVEPI